VVNKPFSSLSEKKTKQMTKEDKSSEV